MNPSMSLALIDEDVAVAQEIFVQQITTLAAIALLLYETCLTADLELAYIWVRGRARMILLFVTIRYMQLASFIINSIALAFVSPELCETLALASAVSVIIPYFGWAVFLGWRAYALSSGNAFVGLLVFICSASFTVPSLVTILGTQRGLLPTSSPTCAILQWKGDSENVARYSLYASRGANILAECVVLYLTFRTTYRAWLSSKRARGPASLHNVLYENGVICFSATTVLHILTMILSILPNSSSLVALTSATASTLRDGLIAALLSRFLLELAGLDARMSDAEQGPHTTPKGILTTEWTEDLSGVPSQWTLDEEYNGRGFDEDDEILEIKAQHEA